MKKLIITKSNGSICQLFQHDPAIQTEEKLYEIQSANIANNTWGKPEREIVVGSNAYDEREDYDEQDILSTRSEKVQVGQINYVTIKTEILPERDIVEFSQTYEESDVIKRETISYTDHNGNIIEENHVTLKAIYNEPEEIVEFSKPYKDEEIISTRSEDIYSTTEYVTLKAEYEITITDLTKDAGWLLSECLRKRKAEYPTVEEIVEALMEKYGENRPEKFAELHAKRMAVKLKYPKP